MQKAEGALVIDVQQTTKALLICAELGVHLRIEQVVFEAAGVELVLGEELQFLNLELTLEGEVQPLGVA